MSKIICDICGTSYPETAESCPICGCSRDAAADFLGDDFQMEETAEEVQRYGRIHRLGHRHPPRPRLR